MASASLGRLSPQRGHTLIEMLVVVAIFGIVAMVGLPHVDTRREEINSASQQLVADLRLARARSITSGERYALAPLGADRYEIQRLTRNAAGQWGKESVVRTVRLPEHIRIEFGPLLADRVEFNTRGMMVSSSQPLVPVVSDVLHSVDRHLAIWPSGQIYLEN